MGRVHDITRAQGTRRTTPVISEKSRLVVRYDSPFDMLLRFLCLRIYILPVSVTTKQVKHNLGGVFKYFYFHPYLGKISNLTNIFQMG